MTALRLIRKCKSIPILLGIAWLPYTTIRCVENPATHEGCGVLPVTAHHHTSNNHEHAATRSTGAQTHNQHRHHSPVRTCCDLTGKCNIKITPSVSSLDPIHLVALLPVRAGAYLPSAELRPYRGGLAHAHAPPTYLLNVALLL